MRCRHEIDRRDCIECLRADNDSLVAEHAKLREFCAWVQSNENNLAMCVAICKLRELGLWVDP